MRRMFFDYDDGDYCNSISDNMAMDSDGNLMMRMSDSYAIDLDSGEMHFISSWDDEEKERSFWDDDNDD